ncbi:MAG: preprotein translocase subunit SecE [Oscillospiraceae bacterium]|nr:preprotein translocase subunit SecE [Oscillospiraceae bacterium]
MAKENKASEKSNEIKETKKAKDTKKPNKVAKWFKDLKIEFNKVTWASWKTVRNNTSIVLTIVVIISAFVGLLDWGLLSVMDLVYNR